MIVPARRLEPPRIVGRLAARPRLARLAAGPARLVLVEGPSGFGKTALLTNLAELAESQGAGVAWASFDRGDDPARALAVIAAALFPAAPIQTLEALLGRLEAEARSRVLFLDDVDRAS